MPVDFGSHPIEAKHGDVFPAVAVLVEIKDADGAAVTDGSPVLRVGKPMSGPYQDAGTHLLDADLIHQGDGVWRWEPAAGEIVTGRWRLSVHTEDATIPGDGYGTLLVRPTLPGAPE